MRTPPKFTWVGTKTTREGVATFFADRPYAIVLTMGNFEQAHNLNNAINKALKEEAEAAHDWLQQRIAELKP